jgi:hypothetical protein
MSRTADPRVPILAGNGAGVWVVLLIGWGLTVAAWLVWLAARIAAALTGSHVPPFSGRWIISLARWRTSQAWPGTPTALVLLIAAALACAAITVVVLPWRVIDARIPRPGDPVAALAVNPQIKALTPVPAAETAIRLRPSLAGADPRKLPPGDTGLLLGDLKRPAGHGPALFASWEDTITALMAPRSGKTTTLSIPYVLSAPGAVVATSNKADLWAATAQQRAESGSTTWLFDPQRITGGHQRWWWDPLAGLVTVEAARRGVPLVRAMVAACGGDHPAHRAVAQLGGDAAPAGHRHGRVATRSPRLPASRPARQDRAVQHVLRGRAHRTPAGPYPAAAGRMVGPGTAEAVGGFASSAWALPRISDINLIHNTEDHILIYIDHPVRGSLRCP